MSIDMVTAPAPPADRPGVSAVLRVTDVEKSFHCGVWPRRRTIPVLKGACLEVAAGLLAIAGVAWFFWGPRRAGVQAALTSSGAQEATIVVKGAYIPNVIVVEHGRPVRLSFLRQETTACSEEVVFPDFARRMQLPAGELVPVEFTPDNTGEYEFHCGMGMLRGTVVVR